MPDEPMSSIYRPQFSTRFVAFMQNRVLAIVGLVFLFTALKWGALVFIVPQYETAIVTRFGKAIRVDQTPGLKFKIPFIDSVHRFDNRILAWDGPPTETPTKDKR